MFNRIYIKPFHNQRKVFLLFYLNFCSSYSFTSCVYSVQKPFHIRNVIILYWHLLTSTLFTEFIINIISLFLLTVKIMSAVTAQVTYSLEPGSYSSWLEGTHGDKAERRYLTCSWPLLILHFFLNVFHYSTLSCSILPSILYQSTSLFTMTILIRPSFSLKLL